MTLSIDRRSLLGGAAVAGAAGLARPALAQDRRQWRMVTSWPKNLPGPGVSAERLASRIGELSGGQLTVEVAAAGKIVPAFEVFDAVSQGVAQMAHTASFFWQGKAPAAVFFTTVPFGLTPPEHVSWIHQGGGQTLWDELYAPFGIKPFMAGNSGFQMGGWFKEPVTSLEDLKGRTIRSAGLGAEVFRELGMGATAVPPAEIFQALQSGVVDAVEFLGPFSDAALGLDEVASHYLWPSFNKPNGTAEALVSRRELEALPAELQAVVSAACAEEASRGLAEADWMNGQTIARLREEGAVTLSPWPQEVIEAARDAADGVMSDLAQSSPEAKAIAASYRSALDTLGGWSRVSMEPFLGARGTAA